MRRRRLPPSPSIIKFLFRFGLISGLTLIWVLGGGQLPPIAHPLWRRYCSSHGLIRHCSTDSSVMFYYNTLLQSISLTHPRLVQSLTATWPVLSTLQSNIVIKWPPEHFIVSNFMYITIFLLSFTQGVGRSELQLCTTDKWQCLDQWY